MKANMTTLSIYELRKTIGLWKSRKITDSTISKLLDLYLGVTAYMNDEAVYPVENFYDLGLSLKFKNARCLVEAVRQSRSFGIVPDGNVYGMKSFYSYLWKAKDAAESLPETLPETLPPFLRCYPTNFPAQCQWIFVFLPKRTEKWGGLL